MKRLTLKDVAKMAGVAPSTVSFVLNGKGKQMRIRDEVATRIMQVAEKSGYEPHRMAVNLRTGQSKTLGLIVESISGSFFASLAKTIETEAERKGYNVVYCSTENNAQKGGELIRMLGRQMVDGYLITPAPGMEKEIQQLVQQHKPVVLMDSYFPSIKTPYVLINNFDGVQQGMKHLISKGFTKIGFVMVDVKLIQIEERLRGYTTALKEHKIPVKKKYILQLQYHRQREDSLNELQAFIEANPELDAIFFSTNYLGILGLEVIARMGLKMPDDIAVLCFDDHDIFRLYPPGISVIEQPIEGIAKTAIDLLMHQLDKNSGPMKKTAVELPGKFILRGSA
ncbi:transcriptional regulator, LacI family [Chitinophaga ginsengisegetis]|uniref:Transcriptional regulator, LacI family n=1 Tax=Chitinophaga ginsengisegetis TaxID=393003 RepID=A0A1T5NPQ9_9BACT|nr:substrate-binding domain-containing protein [Chitinophaga ginsengisegetis]MDR6565675.1 LacI family transcriptional regulator [Chitinophaga ginsengisegetis]MDR6645404.1 LacI family transcriptional regulator [Chitinophaga ginsengisegetis]MDR6652004.1 LacI family transcriptional regulator [Chitinophaga ginsengisegetis]SKD02356.1 transcriptional regulator, LacI family [Chitinophaga ginsengisegetis]